MSQYSVNHHCTNVGGAFYALHESTLRALDPDLRIEGVGVSSFATISPQATYYLIAAFAHAPTPPVTAPGRVLFGPEIDQLARRAVAMMFADRSAQREMDKLVLETEASQLALKLQTLLAQPSTPTPPERKVRIPLSGDQDPVPQSAGNFRVKINAVSSTRTHGAPDGRHIDAFVRVEYAGVDAQGHHYGVYFTETFAFDPQRGCAWEDEETEQRWRTLLEAAAVESLNSHMFHDSGPRVLATATRAFRLHISVPEYPNGPQKFSHYVEEPLLGGREVP